MFLCKVVCENLFVTCVFYTEALARVKAIAEHLNEEKRKVQDKWNSEQNVVYVDCRRRT